MDCEHSSIGPVGAVQLPFWRWPRTPVKPKISRTARTDTFDEIFGDNFAEDRVSYITSIVLEQVCRISSPSPGDGVDRVFFFRSTFRFDGKRTRWDDRSILATLDQIIGEE